MFYERFLANKKKYQSLLCVGLDPLPAKIPEGYGPASSLSSVHDFLADIIHATSQYSIAYKANCAFFEALGPPGMQLFLESIQTIRKEAPHALIIADAKRGDISHSAEAYASAFFGAYDCDALTVNPYIGMDSLEAFLAYPERAVMALCLTSNPGAFFFQNYGQPPLYLHLSRTLEKLYAKHKNIWLVVGATHRAETLAKIREAAPKSPFLMPGIGAQGASIKNCIENAGTNILCNVGRSVLYGAKKKAEVQDKARSLCEKLLEEMAPYL